MPRKRKQGRSNPNVISEEGNSESDNVFDEEELKEWEESSVSSQHKKKSSLNVLKQGHKDEKADDDPSNIR